MSTQLQNNSNTSCNTATQQHQHATTSQVHTNVMMKFIIAAAAALLMARHADAACAANQNGEAGEKKDNEAVAACVADAACLAIVMSIEDSCVSLVVGALCSLTEEDEAAGAMPTSATCAADTGVVCVKMHPIGGDAHELRDASTCSLKAKSTAAAVGTSCHGNANCKAGMGWGCSGTNTKDADKIAMCAALDATPTPAPAASNAAHAAPLLVLLVGYFA
jgi:hypothetical protein